MSNILLVDDDIDLAELVKTKLTDEGHEVACHHTGDGAFELAKKVRPNLLVLDIMLPGITGYQICRRIRKDPELYKAGILILTALGEEPEVMHGIEQGADDYLAKPFKLDTLMEKVRSLEALLESIDRRNPITNLPGTEGAKREINHRLARETALAACYFTLTSFKPYVASKGKKAHEEALSFMSKLLVDTMRSLGIYECYLAHLGGEHFVSVMKLEDYDRFCKAVMSQFDRSVINLYSMQEQTQGYITATNKHGQEGKYPLMALSVGVAHTEHRKFRSANKMFEVLAQARQKAKPEKASAMFVDRRRTDR